MGGGVGNDGSLFRVHVRVNQDLRKRINLVSILRRTLLVENTVPG